MAFKITSAASVSSPPLGTALSWAVEGVGSALGDVDPFAPFLCLLADFPGWDAIVRKRLKE